MRALRGEDIRAVGSGNIGATNVWRRYGARLGVPVMALDVAKGFVPALLATIFVGHLAGVLAGGAAMLGHWRPLFMRFARGGKVVATCGGAFFGVAPLVGGVGAAVWLLVFAMFRYASVASMRGVGIYRSDDAGESWRRITTDPRPTGRIGGGDLPVPVVHPTNPDIVIMASTVTWRSTDGGQTWTGIRGAPGIQRACHVTRRTSHEPATIAGPFDLAPPSRDPFRASPADTQSHW